MGDEEHVSSSKPHDLERHSSTERQTTNWYEVQLIGSGGFGNVTLWRNKVSNAHVCT